MREDINLDTSSEIIPSYDRARYAVERARKIVKENNEFIARLKGESNIEHNEDDSFSEASNFSLEDSYAFDLYKIKSSGGITDFIKDIFGVH
jgi:hypothetical protein